MPAFVPTHPTCPLTPTTVNSHTGPFGKSTASLLEGMAEGEGAPATTDAGGLAGGVVPVFT